MADIDKGEENYLRAVLLLLKGCRYILLEVLGQAENDTIDQSGKDIDAVLKEAKTQLKKKTDRKQRQTLFPDDGSKTQTVTWDISLITLVTLKCYNSSLTQQEHEAVKTIRDERNKILAHSSDASLTRGDYDDVCRALENAVSILALKFDESVRQACEERVQKCLNGNLQTAKNDIKTIQDDDSLCKVLRKKIEELEKKNRELRSWIEQMIRKQTNRIFKTIQVVDTELEIRAPGSDGHTVDMAEQILTAVIDAAAKRVGSDASVNGIRMAVDDILNEIEKCGMKVVSVEQRCIVLRVECTSFYQILQLLEFIEDAKFQSRLSKLADALTALKTDLQHPMELAFRISKKSVDNLLACLCDEDADTKRKISLPVQCPSVAELASFWNFLEEGKGSSGVERLSKALSKHLGKDISITLSLNQEQVFKALQDADKDYATPIASASGADMALRSFPEPSKSSDVSEISFSQQNLADLEEKPIFLKTGSLLYQELHKTSQDPLMSGLTASMGISHLKTEAREERKKIRRHEMEKLKTEAGEKIKRFKAVDEKLLRLRRKFQSTMSQLPGDFLPSYGVSEIKDKLQRHHHVVVSGSQGSRYLETALFAIKNLEYADERCVEMTDAVEWDHIDPEDVDLVVCRNPFGNHVYDKQKAKALYGKFDSILLTVMTRSGDKHLDFILITDSESLMEFEETKEHDLLEVVVKLFAPTSVSRPEGLTVLCSGYLAKGSAMKGHFARQMTDIYLAQDSSHVYQSTTPTVISAMTKLKKNKFLLISGPPNSGKTALAIYLSSSYQPEAVLVLSYSSDIKQLDFRTTSMVIIDEFVGKWGLVVSTIHGWFHTFDLLYKVVCAGKLNVIIVCETENLRRCIEEIGPHPMLTEPENLTGSLHLVNQKHVSVIASTQIFENRQSNSSFPSENRTRSMTSVSQYGIRMSDEKDCRIYGCCMLPHDEILLLDKNNGNLKKLDSSYRLTSTCNLRDVIGTCNPRDVITTTMTYIGNSEAVVCELNSLVYVNLSGNMSVMKTVHLDINCRDVTCRNNKLYVLYETSIQMCTKEGDIISVFPVLPPEQSGGGCRRIEVTDDGRMYVTCSWQKLISLDSSGNVIKTLPVVGLLPVCVDDRGYVWVGGYDSKVYQISADGSQILNTFSVNIVGDIRTMCYDKHRSSLILGGLNNNIIVIGLN